MVARGRATWKRIIDPKTYLTRAMVGLESIAPAVTGALGYYSILQPPSRFEALTEERVPSPLLQPRYAAAFENLSKANVDTPTGQAGHAGHRQAGEGGSPLGPLQPLETRRVAAVLADVLVPGHTLLPVDGRTGRLLSIYGGGHVNWGRAYPAPASLRRAALPGFAWAVPSVHNYYHLLVEHILPVVDELIRHREQYRGVPVTVIGSERLPTVRFFLGLLADVGIQVDVVEANAFTTWCPERYLFCKPVSATVEHFYAYAEAVGILKEAIERRSGRVRPSRRIYIPRTGTRIRRLATEEALVEQLAARGFAAFGATWSNTAQQVEAFMGAREIVSVHGAALTNLIWASPEAQVVELFPENARKTTYLHMAAQHGQAYACVIGGPEDGRQDFGVPVERVLGTLGD
ncbi:glycosyltransferase family 61 protein [Salinarimonas soli]|uniref:Glycosyltransferase family 61 protein n=1 Tax=Salinarimonas soli TaxID=1638099 RepID=A0A5B2V8C9_9HYPH|nr:glycosyltransferase family 61 protein [Salinarimonas soli]KAA2235231.1 glycosyltransferase family 61 protein [Salinarimonas soli]